MKIRKISALIACITACLLVCSLAACGGDDTDKGGVNTLVMEAEYIDLDNVAGSGLSSDQSGVEMIYGDGTDAQIKKGWSGGYYVGYTYTPECEMEFVFTSDKETTATLVIRLGSELGDISLTPSIFKISLNGNSISYGTFFVENSAGMADMKFKDYTLTTSAKLVAGENKITLSVQPNNLRGSSSGGPTIDCVKVTADAKLEFNAKTDNPSRRGAI